MNGTRTGRSWRKLIKIMLILLSIAIIVKVYYELKLIDLFIGIFKLEKEKKDIVSVSNKSLMYIARRDIEDEVFFEKMQLMGWHYIQVYGRGYLFERDGEEVLVTKRTHLNYAIYEIHSKEFFLSRVDELM